MVTTSGTDVHDPIHCGQRTHFEEKCSSREPTVAEARQTPSTKLFVETIEGAMFDLASQAFPERNDYRREAIKRTPVLYGSEFALLQFTHGAGTAALDWCCLQNGDLR